MQGEELLGKAVKDKVSGLTGVCTSICIMIDGTVYINVQRLVDANGALPEIAAFQLCRIEVIGPGPNLQAFTAALERAIAARPKR